jgi:hypothetical protein
MARMRGTMSWLQGEQARAAGRSGAGLFRRYRQALQTIEQVLGILGALEGEELPPPRPQCGPPRAFRVGHKQLASRGSRGTHSARAQQGFRHKWMRELDMEGLRKAGLREK